MKIITNFASMDMKYFTNRRSIRRFHDDPIDKELIATIVRQAAKAPTTGNMQLYSAIITSTPEARKRLAAHHFNQPASTSAPALITVCVDFNRFEQWCKLGNAEPGFNNLQGMLYGVLDAVIFAQQIVTVAELMGLGTCYLGTTPFNAPEIATELRLPPRVMPITTIAIGYPDEAGEATERILPEGYLHFESYTPFSDADIARIYAPKDNLEANKKFVTENGKESLAQVFTEVRYPKAMNEDFSTKLIDWLKATGMYS